MAGIRRAKRSEVFLKIQLTAPSGGGKTFGALLLSRGFNEGDLSKTVVLDTENGSADLYDDLGEYSVLPLKPPFDPRMAAKAIDYCIKEGFTTIILDSLTHFWSGTGGALDIQQKLGGRFQDWKKAGEIYNVLIDKILQSQAHIITCTRKKEEHVIEEGSNGKKEIKKKGLKDEVRDGFGYEVTVALDIQSDTHLASATKDRTRIFEGMVPFLITDETGKKLGDWAQGKREKDSIDI